MKVQRAELGKTKGRKCGGKVGVGVVRWVVLGLGKVG